VTLVANGVPFTIVARKAQRAPVKIEYGAVLDIRSAAAVVGRIALVRSMPPTALPKRWLLPTAAPPPHSGRAGGA
jgi:hypothetical protein